MILNTHNVFFLVSQSELFPNYDGGNFYVSQAVNVSATVKRTKLRVPVEGSPKQSAYLLVDRLSSSTPNKQQHTA